MASPKRWIHCKNCGRNKPYWANGLCKVCYMRQWREDNREHVRQHREKTRAIQAEEVTAAALELIDTYADKILQLKEVISMRNRRPYGGRRRPRRRPR